MAREFLVTDRRAMGGLWAVVLAQSASEVMSRFHDIEVLSQRPYFMSPELYERIRKETGFPVDKPQGWLAGRLHPLALPLHPVSPPPIHQEPAKVQTPPADPTPAHPQESAPEEPEDERSFSFYAGLLVYRIITKELIVCCTDYELSCKVDRSRKFFTVRVTVHVRGPVPKWRSSASTSPAHSRPIALGTLLPGSLARRTGSLRGPRRGRGIPARS